MTAVAFSLTPGKASTETLDYTTAEGIKLYNKATKGMEPPYDLSGEGLYAFLRQVSHQVNQINWDNIINVPVTVGEVILTRDLLIQHGMLTLAQVHAHVLTYQGLDGRAEQNSQQMYTFLFEYLDAQACMCMCMSMQEEQYKITVGSTSYYSEPLYLKALVGIAHIDTRSTASHLRETMSSLEKYIVTVDYDIKTFNQYVAAQRSALLAWGETSNDF